MRVVQRAERKHYLPGVFQIYLRQNSLPFYEFNLIRLLDIVRSCLILLVTESMGKCLLCSNETWLCCAPCAEGCNCNGGTLAVVLGAKGAPQIQFWDLNDLG